MVGTGGARILLADQRREVRHARAEGSSVAHPDFAAHGPPCGRRWLAWRGARARTLSRWVGGGWVGGWVWVCVCVGWGEGGVGRDPNALEPITGALIDGRADRAAGRGNPGSGRRVSRA